MPSNSKNMFEGTRSVRDLTSYMLMRGVTDFGDLEQYNLFESGYSFLVVMDIPKFLKDLFSGNDEYKNIITSYVHILEFEFRGLSGLENMTAESGQLTNGINQINIINKINKQSDGSFSCNYQEKLGSTITKAQELFLSGIKDPRTQVKNYHGLIEANRLEPGYQYEIFKFMYIVADNTLRKLEKAVYLASCQPTNAPFDIYNSEKGTYEFKEISVEFNGFPVMSRNANAKAKTFLKQIYDETYWMESEFTYNFIDNAKMYSLNNSPKRKKRSGNSTDAPW